MRTKLTIILSVALVLVMVAPAHAARSDQKAIWGPARIGGVSQFPIYHDLGVGIYEDAIGWDTIATRRPRDPRNPRDPAYNWSPELDYAIAQARRYRMRVMLMIINAPKWANGGRGPNYAPTRVADYASFAVAAARRYPGVHLWMVWGEPSRVHRWAPMVKARPGHRLSAAQAAAPRRYARLLDATYGVLKRMNRGNLIIGGNTYTTGDISTAQWIHYMRLPNGRPPRLDLYGHNPFSFRGPSLRKPPSPMDQVDFSDLGRLAQRVNRELAPRGRLIRLFLSEWTIPTAPKDQEFNFYTTLGVQAQWIRDAWRIVRSSPSIYSLGWIHLYDDPPGGSKGGLLFADGRKKPGYFAFKAG